MKATNWVCRLGRTRGDRSKNRSILGATGRSGCLGLGTVVLLFAAGCGDSSKPKAPAAPAAAAANENEEEKAEAPAAPEPATPEKEKKVVAAKPAAPELARRAPRDPTKWELPDLKNGLATRDMQFVPAVMFFSMQNLNGADRAKELRTLLERAAQMKDDSVVSLPLPPPPVASVAPKAASAPATPAPPATAAAPQTPADAAPTPGMGRGPRKRGGGLAGKLKAAE